MGARSHKTKETIRNPKSNASPLQEAPNSKNGRSLQPSARQAESDHRRTGHIALAVESNRTKLKRALKTNDK